LLLGRGGKVKSAEASTDDKNGALSPKAVIVKKESHSRKGLQKRKQTTKYGVSKAHLNAFKLDRRDKEGSSRSKTSSYRTDSVVPPSKSQLGKASGPEKNLNYWVQTAKIPEEEKLLKRSILAWK
jgi:hypothetical protein